MLDTLEDVAWEDLRDAYGSAEGIPDLLYALTDDDEHERASALEQLSMALCPQRASLVEATPWAVPFLLELAEQNDAGRGGILELLEGIAEQATYGEDEPGGAVRRALCEGRPILLRLLADDDAELRARAALIAATLPGDRESLVAALVQRMHEEPDADTRVAYVEALERLSARDALRPLLSDRAQAVRLSAAFALLGPDGVATSAFEIVRAALSNPAATRQAYGQASRYRSLGLVERVCKAGFEVARALLPELLRLLATSSAMMADDDLAPLLDTFLPRGLAVPPSLEQSALLATIAQHRRYFGVYRNADAVLEARDLPARPCALRELATTGPAEHRALVPTLAPLPPAATLLARMLGTRAAAEVESLVLVACASDALLELLADCVALRELTIKSALPGALGLLQLGRLPRLTLLVLEDGALDAEAAARLCAFPALETLYLTDMSLAPEARALLRSARFTVQLDGHELG